jgi:threonine/homoserine/homoserine lactone efflux protein
MGGIFVLYLGWQSMVTKGIELNLEGVRPNSLTKGIIVNTLNPHPYLFWFGVGGPTVTKAMKLGMVAPLVFVGSFYVLLVGSKILIAVLVGKSRSFLTGKGYIYTMRLLGVALCALAMILFQDGFKLLGFI